jgi:hypothetical protein
MATIEEMPNIMLEILSMLKRIEKKLPTNHAVPLQPSVVTQKQAAEMLGVSVGTINSYLKSGLLRYNKMGKIPAQQVQDMLLESSGNV